jgi:hypothetical protein
MEQTEPPPGTEREAGSAEQSEDPLRRLEAQLERASAAAERLIAEAATEAGAAAARMGERLRPPPSGWQAPASEPSGETGAGQVGDRELELLVGILDSLRELVPPELRRRVADALTELLLAVRALIDWYLERLEGERRNPVEVEDIPVE